MAVRLHRCPVMWPKTGKHPCWNVQMALDEAGIEYEIVKEPWPLKGRRTNLLEKTGQKHLPALELEDGSWYREESADMARRIRAGGLAAVSRK
jgi:glutathione S-transferase